MSNRVAICGFALLLIAPRLAADEPLYRYEGDVLPYDKSAGWIFGSYCEPPCSESIENGRFMG